jgi:hypothetical protein
MAKFQPTATWLVTAITFVASIGFFVMGYDNGFRAKRLLLMLGLMSNLITLPQFLEQYNPTTRETGIIVAFFSLGA